MMKVKNLLFIIAIPCLLTACERFEKSAKDETVSSRNQPDRIMTDSETYLLEGTRRAGIISSKLLKAYAKIDTTLLYEVKIRFFDSTGAQTLLLTADSGYVTAKSTRMEVVGNVRATSNDNRRLIADSLRWESDQGKVFTEGYVELYRGEDKISGWGLETDQRLENPKIKRNIKGSFADPTATDD